jgi:hypothetical protein
MQLIVSATNVQVGETFYPLNSLFFKTDGTNISIYQVGINGAIIIDIYSNFTNASHIPFTSAADVIAVLKTSLVTP